MTEPRPAPFEARLAGVRVAVDAMGGDHGPSEIVPGVLDFAVDHPDDRMALVGDEATLTRIAGPLPANVSIVHASQVVEMDEHPALALREKKDSSILVATDLVRAGRGRRGHHRRPHRGGHGRRGPAAGPPARRRPARVGRPDDHDQRADGPARHRGQPGLHPREPGPVRTDGRDLRRARPGRRPGPCRAPLDRRGEGQGRRPDRPRDRAARRDAICSSSATSRART